MINIIKRQLGIIDDSQDEILTELFNRYLRMAKAFCRRDDEPLVMIDIVQDITAGAYNQRGGEGFISSNSGEQSYNHIDLYDIMCKRLTESGLRMLRAKFI